MYVLNPRKRKPLEITRICNDGLQRGFVVQEHLGFRVCTPLRFLEVLEQRLRLDQGIGVSFNLR